MTLFSLKYTQSDGTTLSHSGFFRSKDLALSFFCFKYSLSYFQRKDVVTTKPRIISSIQLALGFDLSDPLACHTSQKS